MIEVDVSLFADDMKLKKRIKALTDPPILQSAIDALHEWSAANSMVLNGSKCAVISFSRRKSKIIAFYKIDNVTLERKTHVRDLGIILQEDMSFKKQIDHVVTNGFRALFFVKRRVKDLNCPYITKQLYNTYVLPIIDYLSAIWAPYRQVDMKRIESIQKQLLIFALRHLGFSGPILPPYKSRLLLLSMIPLEMRFELNSALLAFDILENRIKVPSLKKKLIMNDNKYTLRNSRLLVEERRATDFSKNNAINRAIMAFNRYSEFYTSGMARDTFKIKILDKMKTIHS